MIATGLSWRKLDVPGLDRLTGAGAYYGAALTEGISCQDEDVFVVGGANSAGQGAIHFAQYARKVTLLVRADSLDIGMSKYLVDQINATPNIEVLTNTEVSMRSGRIIWNASRIEIYKPERNRPFPIGDLYLHWSSTTYRLAL